MNAFDYLSWSYYQKHDELIRQADEYRKLSEAFRIKKQPTSRLSKFLTTISHVLGNVGHSFEIRYSSQADPQETLDRQNDLFPCP